jgi:hypothetical protein
MRQGARIRSLSLLDRALDLATRRRPMPRRRPDGESDSAVAPPPSGPQPLIGGAAVSIDRD